MRPRILHWRMEFVVDDVACGKAVARVRSCATLATWDSKAIAGGRRCPDCAKVVEAMRKKQQEKGR